MATQTTQPQERGMTRGSGKREYSVGFPLTPAEFLRTNPFSLMRRMTEELDRIFGETDGREGERVWAPAIEVTQREGNYMVHAELPGIKPDDVKLEVTDEAIVIQGERKLEQEETKGGIHVTERHYGRFYRAVPLPEGAKPEEAKAKFENGILEVTVPVEQPKSQRREIPIQAGTGAGSQPTGTTEKAA